MEPRVVVLSSVTVDVPVLRVGESDVTGGGGSGTNDEATGVIVGIIETGDSRGFGG